MIMKYHIIATLWHDTPKQSTLCSVSLDEDVQNQSNSVKGNKRNLFAKSICEIQEQSHFFYLLGHMFHLQEWFSWCLKFCSSLQPLSTLPEFAHSPLPCQSME